MFRYSAAEISEIFAHRDPALPVSMTEEGWLDLLPLWSDSLHLQYVRFLGQVHVIDLRVASDISDAVTYFTREVLKKYCMHLPSHLGLSHLGAVSGLLIGLCTE